MIAIIMGEPDPFYVARIYNRLKGLHKLASVFPQTSVKEDRLFGFDDKGVDRKKANAGNWMVRG